MRQELCNDEQCCHFHDSPNELVGNGRPYDNAVGRIAGEDALWA